MDASSTPFRALRVPGEVDLSVGLAGDVSENPVVALHGISAHHRAFNALALRVCRSRGFIAPDLRGRGDSEKPSSGYGMEAHAADVVGLLDHFGIRRASLAGHSMGAFVAIQTALSYPDRVRSLVLLDGGWPRAQVSTQEMTPEQAAEARAVQEGLSRAFARLEMVFAGAEEYLDFWYPGQGLSPGDLPSDVADYFLYDLEDNGDGYSPKCSLSAATEDSRWLTEHGPTVEDLARVGAPVALVRAGAGFFPESDPLISEAVLGFMSGALDIQREERLPDASHYTMLYEPHVGEFATLLASESWSR